MSIQKTAEGKNFTAINIGELSKLDQYEHGKVFLKDAAKMTGSEISFTVYPPGGSIPFFHSHKTHEEVYVIIKGEGEYQIDNTIIPIKEGSVIRVGTGASRNLKNTGTEPMIVMCEQSVENTLKGDLMADCDIPQTEPKFSK